ncbi:hypothetical protein [Streptomyces sp. NPDC002573]|uniref:hypothetical protein n=1 Tax=Streptomyces sp. NPDC002573 TaxID=3364651 RepID=UPI0036A26FCC
MATLLRSGRLQMFAETRPGPKGPSKAVATVREKVLALRADQRGVTEIAAALTMEIPLPWWNDRTLRFHFPTLNRQSRPQSNFRTGNRG